MLTRHLSNRNIGLAGIAAVLIVAFLLVGQTGPFVIAGMILFFVLTPYAILRTFPITQDEKWFFSLFIGLGLFSTAVWMVGRIAPFRLSVIATLVILLLVGLVLQKFQKRVTAIFS